MNDCPFSPRVLKIVTLLADGYVRKQIAAMLGIAENTIDTDLKVARGVSRAKTNAHVVATALRNGWIV